MRRLFKVGADRHDTGKVTFSWHPEGNFLATAGRNGLIILVNLSIYERKYVMISISILNRYHTYNRSPWRYN